MYAFNNYYPISLKPDKFWQLLLEIVSYHVANHSEELRDKFVASQDKKEITVKRDDFELGKPNNNWPSVFGCFVNPIKAQTHPNVYETLIS